jgi:deoxycytidylate deaminase
MTDSFSNQQGRTEVLVSSTEYSGPELFFGLVGAVGTDLKNVESVLARELQAVGYNAHEIRVSALLKELAKYAHLDGVDARPEHERIKAYMDAGDDFRRTSGRGDAMALLVMGKIRDLREEMTGEDAAKPVPGQAYIINSLKHPLEVDTLRNVYGAAFFAISVYETKDLRLSSLCEKIAKSTQMYDSAQFKNDAEDLIERDQKDIADDLGQDVRDVFPKSDLFLNANDTEGMERQIRRFVKILFGFPFGSPTVDEYCMFHARASALRSVDLSRQVGSVIARDKGEILSTGCNEVPYPGGGSIWESEIDEKRKDNRDFVVGYDSSARMAHELVREVLKNLGDAGWLMPERKDADPDILAQDALFRGNSPPLKGTRAASVLEFGRVVHAEMAAISDAARRGVAIGGATLYCTTFPCHMCARHIISSGIGRVVYIEPYPKSLTKHLHSDAACIDYDNMSPSHAVKFEPFNGIAPRRYFDLFEMKGARKDKTGRAITWQPQESAPKISQFATYPDLESAHVELLEQNQTAWGIIAPDMSGR